jgi:hypothetical protein
MSLLGNDAFPFWKRPLLSALMRTRSCQTLHQDQPLVSHALPLAPTLPDRQARKRGGEAKKRGLSDEQGPILVAADRSGASVSAVLPAVTADAIRSVLAPVLDQDALLVTDGCPSYPPCAAAWGVSHEGLNQSDGERVRGEWHI